MKKEFESGHITRHCEFVRTWQSDEIASHSFAMARERGRTLVEMLSTLAIMGILSITGIWTYGVAMHRHKANTLIQEAQKRAVIVAMQATQGQNNFFISEFTNPVGYLFDVKNWNNTQFAITLTDSDGQNIDESICQQLKNTVGVTTPIREIRQNCTHFIFNKDLSTKETENTTCTTDSQCDGCQKCQNGFCVSKCTENEICAKGNDTSSYICQNTPTICQSCTKDQWCEINSDNCSSPTSATCKSVETEADFQNKKATIYSLSSRTPITVWQSSNQMSWWSAKNWCEAHGKRMISFKVLELPKPASHACSPGGCGIPEEYWLEMEQILGSYIYWVSESYTSCNSYNIRPKTFSSRIDHNGRQVTNRGKALCY